MRDGGAAGGELARRGFATAPVCLSPAACREGAHQLSLLGWGGDFAGGGGVCVCFALLALEAPGAPPHPSRRPYLACPQWHHLTLQH